MIKKIIYRNLPPAYASFLKRAYHFFLGFHVNSYNYLKHNTTDMFNALNIETTTYCNRRCYYCPNSLSDRGLKENERYMQEDLFKKIIDELAGMDFRGRISPHLYGEPLLDKRLPALIGYAHDKLPRARLEIYTNGDFLDIGMLDRLYEAGVQHYYVTLHGTGKEQKEGKKRIDKLEQYIKKAKRKIKIDLLILGKENPLSTRAGLVKVNITKKTPICLFYNSPLAINYQGDVVLCCEDYLGEVVLGNLENENLMDIWNKKNFKDIRRQLRKSVYKLNICKRCTENIDPKNK